VPLGARSCPSTRASNVVMREGLFCLGWLGQSLTHSHSSAYGWISGAFASQYKQAYAHHQSGVGRHRHGLGGGLDADLRPALVTASRDNVIEWSRTAPCRTFCIARFCDRTCLKEVRGDTVTLVVCFLLSRLWCMPIKQNIEFEDSWAHVLTLWVGGKL
jgi:hypothetical protein